MSESYDLLRQEHIQRHFLTHYGFECRIFSTIESTNTEIVKRLGLIVMPQGYCVTAESQQEGRGRRGKKWVSPYGKSLYFSFFWQFQGGLSEIEGLSLVIGMSIADTLACIGIKGVSLKWPNDIYINGKKVGGILVETSTDNMGYCNTVIGVGLNVYRHENNVDVIDQAWTTLDSESHLKLDRTQLFLILIDNILGQIKIFEKNGFSAFLDKWKKFDMHFLRDVMVIADQKTYLGVSEGINKKGELIIKTSQGRMTFGSGEVSLRLNCDFSH